MVHREFPSNFLVPRLLLCAVILSTTASCGSAEDGVDALVRAHMQKRQIPGVAVVVARDGRVLKSQGYGVADLESKQAVTAETVFPVQSITKQFTATAIMMLVEAGQVGLDDPIGKHLNGTPPAWEKITVRQLLTHTSGIQDFINEPVGPLDRDLSEEEILRAVANRPLKFAPGDAWAYSNTNYHLLAMIIRKATGMWYGDFLAERIFKPLGMSRTWVARPDGREGDVARGYVMEQGKHRPATVLPPTIAGYGGGGIRSTVLDMAKWDASLYGEQLLKRSSLEAMWTPVRLNSGASHRYAFGWEIGTINEHRMLWHAGGWVGFSAQIDRFVDDRLTVIVLTNVRNADPGRLARAIAGTYLPAVAPAEYKPIPDKEPRVTERFVDVLRRSGEGTLRPDEFTPPVWEYISANTQQMRSDMSALGPIQKLTFVERTENDGNASYRYRAQFKNTTLILHFVLTKEGKIAVMLPEEVNQ